MKFDIISIGISVLSLLTYAFSKQEIHFLSFILFAFLSAFYPVKNEIQSLKKELNLGNIDQDPGELVVRYILLGIIAISFAMSGSLRDFVALVLLYSLIERWQIRQELIHIRNSLRYLTQQEQKGGI
jgi:TRAP-type mannitol/chloroaromatic compound transport system permease small subunit